MLQPCLRLCIGQSRQRPTELPWITWCRLVRLDHSLEDLIGPLRVNVGYHDRDRLLVPIPWRLAGFACPAQGVGFALVPNCLNLSSVRFDAGRSQLPRSDRQANLTQGRFKAELCCSGRRPTAGGDSEIVTVPAEF